MHRRDISVPIHVAPVGLSRVRMVAVDAVLVGVEPVRWMQGNPTAPLLFVYFLGEAVDKGKVGVSYVEKTNLMLPSCF